MRKWYKLDNIGIFYAFTKNAKIPKVFRFSITLIEEIDENILENALNQIIPFYPNFNVNLKKGFYWYYLDETQKKNRVTKENLPICYKLYNDVDDFLYRVTYYKNRINLEVSHILSDGLGSIEFFKHLITLYLNIKYNIDCKYENPNSELEKTEDSFTKYYKKTKLPRKQKLPVYLYKGRKYINDTRYLECHLDLDEVKKLSNKYKTSITIFLISTLIYSFKDKLKLNEMNENIRIDVPVDLRKYFNSNTLMNFFGLTTITYNFRLNSDLEDIIKEVEKQFKENLTKEKLSERVNLMVSCEKNILFRLVPTFIKEPILNIVDKITTNMSTTCFSNLGVISFDKKLEKYITNISALTSTNGFQFTVCSYKNDLCIGISNRYIRNDIIKNYLRYFSFNNIKVKVNVSEVNE